MRGDNNVMRGDDKAKLTCRLGFEFTITSYDIEPLFAITLFSVWDHPAIVIYPHDPLACPHYNVDRMCIESSLGWNWIWLGASTCITDRGTSWQAFICVHTAACFSASPHAYRCEKLQTNSWPDIHRFADLVQNHLWKWNDSHRIQSASPHSVRMQLNWIESGLKWIRCLV